MTDLFAASGSDTASTEVVDIAGSPAAAAAMPSGDRPVEWAPMEPTPKKRRVGLWLGIGAGVVVLGAVAASLVLIAPGTSVAGIDVGWRTPAAAAETISNRLATTEVTLTGIGGNAVVTGANLGATADAKALADQSFAERPMWNVTSWMGDPIPAKITFDEEKAKSTLRSAAPASFTEATDATVVFDAKTGKYATTPAAPGSGIDVSALGTAFTDAISAGKSGLSFTGDPVKTPAEITDQEAAATAKDLNGMLDAIGFYVGDERTVPVTAETAATWLKVVPTAGQLRIEADPTAIQAVVDTLPKAVNRDPVNASVVVNSSGKVLHTIAAGETGRTLGDVSGVAKDFAQQLSGGNAAFKLPVEEAPFKTTEVVRKVEVNLTQQRLYLYENGKVIDSWLVSSGKRGTDTETGNYAIKWKLNTQNMGHKDTTIPPYYYQPNVRWVMYYNGDQALHGVYWHQNFGTRMSHGCVGMPESRAKQIYDWAPYGVEVTVRN